VDELQPLPDLAPEPLDALNAEETKLRQLKPELRTVTKIA
jgi:hypothetical protein